MWGKIVCVPRAMVVEIRVGDESFSSVHASHAKPLGQPARQKGIHHRR